MLSNSPLFWEFLDHAISELVPGAPKKPSNIFEMSSGNEFFDSLKQKLGGAKDSSDALGILSFFLSFFFFFFLKSKLTDPTNPTNQPKPKFGL